MKMKKILIHYGIPLGLGALSAFVCRKYFSVYGDIVKPPLAPPAFLFPIVWTALYALMGYSTDRVSKKDVSEKKKKQAYLIYGIQLILNVLWPVAFFVWQNFLVSLIILVFMYIFVWLMIESFKEIDYKAGKAQMPYAVWSTFALYLNLAVLVLNPL